MDWPPRQLEKIKHALEGMAILGLDAESSAVAGQVAGWLTRSGQATSPRTASSPASRSGTGPAW